MPEQRAELEARARDRLRRKVDSRLRRSRDAGSARSGSERMARGSHLGTALLRASTTAGSNSVPEPSHRPGQRRQRLSGARSRGRRSAPRKFSATARMRAASGNRLAGQSPSGLPGAVPPLVVAANVGHAPRGKLRAGARSSRPPRRGRAPRTPGRRRQRHVADVVQERRGAQVLEPGRRQGRSARPIASAMVATRLEWPCVSGLRWSTACATAPRPPAGPRRPASSNRLHVVQLQLGDELRERAGPVLAFALGQVQGLVGRSDQLRRR